MILGILQARTSSTRLPGKVLLPLLGKPMLLRQIERVSRTTGLDRLIVATSTDCTDDAIEELCSESGLGCFRGSLDDVLDRFYQAAMAYTPDYVVRMTGDCPLVDPGLIDRVIAFALEHDYDYASNTLEPTFPDGLDVEVFRLSCLETTWSEARLPSEREHVTAFIYKHPERFRLGSFKGEEDFSSLRWTVDESEDFAFVKRVYKELYPQNPAFSTDNIFRLLQSDESLGDINTKFQRNEGYEKSIAADSRLVRK